MLDILTLSSSVVPDSARVMGFRGTESISRPYEIEVCFTLSESDAQDFDMLDAVGARAVLTVDRGDPAVPPFLLAGVFGGVELLSQVGDRVLFRSLLVPRLAQLALSRHSRIFSRVSLPEVLAAVLKESGLTSDDFELRLGSYEIEEHICQYRESDLDFLSRWMEREGVYYYFEHEEHGERIIFCDGRAYDAEKLGVPVRYHPQSGDVSAGACLRTFACRVASLPASVRLRDYDYTRPKLDVSGVAAVSRSGAGEVSLCGERFFTPVAGERLARIRAEEMLARQVVYHAGGNRLHLRPGLTFELEDHPRAAFNAKYLTTEITHHGNQTQGGAFDGAWRPVHEEVYFAEVAAIPADTQFRAESRTPWPRIFGFENGFIDGPADSEYAQIDEHGRYKVKLHFDESNLKGGAGSTFLRMMQPHGGSVEGFHFPLRKGTEVLVIFLGGDPDRPVISGVVPNALTPSPVTVTNHTTNVIQTGAKNRLELEDKAGAERVTLSTPHLDTYVLLGAPQAGHHLVFHTDGNAKTDVLGDQDIIVNGHLHESVFGEVMEYYDARHHTEVYHGDRYTGVWEGGLYSNVGKDFSVRTVEGVSFLVNYSYYMYPVPAEEKGFFVSASERIYLKSRDKSFEVDADQDIRLTSAKGAEVSIDAQTGKVKIHAKAGIDITSEEKITVDGKTDAVSITAGNTMSMTFGNSTSFTAGNTTEATVGDSDSQTYGDSNSVTFGVDHSRMIGLTISEFYGLSLDLQMAIAISVNAGLSVDLSLAEFSKSAIDFGDKDTKVHLGALQVLQKAFSIFG